MTRAAVEQAIAILEKKIAEAKAERDRAAVRVRHFEERLAELERSQGLAGVR